MNDPGIDIKNILPGWFWNKLTVPGVELQKTQHNHTAIHMLVPISTYYFMSSTAAEFIISSWVSTNCHIIGTCMCFKYNDLMSTWVDRHIGEAVFAF